MVAGHGEVRRGPSPGSGPWPTWQGDLGLVPLAVIGPGHFISNGFQAPIVGSSPFCRSRVIWGRCKPPPIPPRPWIADDGPPDLIGRRLIRGGRPRPHLAIGGGRHFPIPSPYVLIRRQYIRGIACQSLPDLEYPGRTTTKFPDWSGKTCPFCGPTARRSPRFVKKEKKKKRLLVRCACRPETSCTCGDVRATGLGPLVFLLTSRVFCPYCPGWPVQGPAAGHPAMDLGGEPPPGPAGLGAPAATS